MRASALSLHASTLGALPPYQAPRYRPPSKFPSTYRDVALVVDADVRPSRSKTAVARALGPLCTGVRVFDEYRGPQVDDGRKSIAVRVTLQRFDATITDEEADAAIARVLEPLGETLRCDDPDDDRRHRMARSSSS